MQIDSFLSALGSVTVLGSNGFIGSAICDALQQYFVSSANKYERLVDTLTTSHYHTAFFNSPIHQFLSSTTDLQGHHGNQVFIFAFGSGGFSLTNSAANHQIAVFLDFLQQFKNLYPYARSIHISSLGAMTSSLESAYKHLTQVKESTILAHDAGHILRLPGVWGFHSDASGRRSPRGVIGYLIDRTSQQTPVDIYADMLTSRYYLNIQTIAAEVLSLILAHLEHQDFPTVINLVPFWKLDINSLIALVSTGLDMPVPFRLSPGARADCESHSLATLDGATHFVREPFDLRILAWPNYH